LGKDPNNSMQVVYVCVYVCGLQSRLNQLLKLNVSYVIFCIYSHVYIQQFLLTGYLQLRGWTGITYFNLLIIKIRITFRNS